MEESIKNFKTIPYTNKSDNTCLKLTTMLLTDGALLDPVDDNLEKEKD